MKREERRVEDRWHLDKRVPIAIILGLFLQTIYFTIFLTSLDNRVEVLEKKSIDIHKTISSVVELSIHQKYMSEKLDKIDTFLRDDVEWQPQKKKSRR